MGIGTDVYELVHYEGASGCVHRLLVRAGQPSYPNADQGAEDAALAFADSAMAHMRAWFERWRLPRLCPAQHAARAEPWYDEVEGPGFRWVELAVDGTPVTAYLLTDAGADGDLRDG